MADGAHFSNSETADDYLGILVCSGRHRVVRCKDDIQFVVQRREAVPPGGGKWPWKARAYVLNASALPAILQRPSMGIPPADLSVLLSGLDQSGVR